MGKRSGAGRVRIIAGEFGGRFIATPRGKVARPTLSQVRESVFNILGPTLDGLVCADLFAGSGAYGFEALSRGAARVEFFEAHRGVAQVITANATSLLGAQSRESMALVQGSLPQSLARARWAPYDLVFMDPPWGEGHVAKVQAVISPPQADLLAPGARVVVEESHAHVCSPQVWSELGFELLTSRRYGEAVVQIARLV